MTETDPAKQPKKSKPSHVGTPAIFKLELACQTINKVYGGQCYLVGSCLDRPDWRDIDVRMILDDEAFEKLFPDAPLHSAAWEFDARWLFLVARTADWLKEQSGLPVDFQFQPRTFANERHPYKRNAIGMRVVK